MFKPTRLARTALIAAAMLGCSVGSAQATTIAAGSTLNFAGQSSCTTAECSFGNAIVTSGTGSFSGFTFLTPATFSTISTSVFTPQLIYTATDALGQTVKFFTSARLSTATDTTGALTSYTINDIGTVQLTGFDDTPGALVFTANQSDTASLGSFSVTAIASAAPEPATWAMMILGFGFAGMSLRSSRRARGELAVA